MDEIKPLLFSRTPSRAAVDARAHILPGRGTLGRWLQYWRTRQMLLELTDEQLKDVGLSRADAVREGSKPFWLG